MMSSGLKRTVFILVNHPLIGYGPFAKIVFCLFFLFNISNKSLVKLLFITLIVTTLGAYNFYNGYGSPIYIVYDLIIIFLIFFLFILKIKHNLEPPSYEMLLMVPLILISLLFFSDSFGFYDDYGGKRLHLGFGPASASILFALCCLQSAFMSNKTLSTYLMIIFMIFLLLSGGRAPILFTFLFLGIYLYKFSKLRLISIMSIFILLFGSLGLFDAIVSRSRIFEVTSILDINTSGRIFLWTSIIAEIGFNDFIRNGIGSLGHTLSSISFDINYVEDQFHSEILRMYLLFGYVGVFLYLMLMVKYILSFINRPSAISGTISLLLCIGLTDNILIYLHFWMFIFIINYKFIKCPI